MTTHPQEENRSNPTNYTYLANSFRTSLVIYFFWIFITLSVITPMLGIYTLVKYNIALREQTNIAKEAFLSVAKNYDTLGEWTSITFILCAIVFSFWIYRASVNTHAFNPKTKIKSSPGWCVGYYFIPILNLYWPYKSMKELWILNVKSDANIILSWWLIYLIFNVTTTVASKFLASGDLDLNGYILLDTASNIFGIISAIIATKIVTEINKAQINKFKLAITNKRGAP